MYSSKKNYNLLVKVKVSKVRIFILLIFYMTILCGTANVNVSSFWAKKIVNFEALFIVNSMIESFVMSIILTIFRFE